VNNRRSKSVYESINQTSHVLVPALSTPKGIRSCNCDYGKRKNRAVAFLGANNLRTLLENGLLKQSVHEISKTAVARSCQKGDRT
jgi:hypothetical protein